MKQLKDIGELAILKFITEKINQPDKSSQKEAPSYKNKLNLLKGIGDDAAVLDMGDNNSLLISKDILVENIHFRLSYTTPDYLARKAIAVNLSDIAAMGGFPRWALVGLSLPSTTSLSFIEKIYEAFLNSSTEYDFKIIGGDTCSSCGPIMISITMIGEIKTDKIIYRNGAKIGDRIMVSGTLGGSNAGLSLLESNKVKDLKEKYRDKSNKKISEAMDHLISKHLLPIPRLKIGALLAENGLATSMIDVSDGLVQDLGHICRQSNVGAEIIKSALPVNTDIAGIEALLKNDKKDRYDFALYGGEDYELLFTVPADKGNNVKELIYKSTGILVTDIGAVVSSVANEISIIDENGLHYIPEKNGFEHFMEDKLL